MNIKQRLTKLRGDTMILDRWRWINKYLPKTKNKEELLDIGCGEGLFSVYAERKGYIVTGLTWDKLETKKAKSLSKLKNCKNCNFVIQDARKLDEKKEWKQKFDVIICAENIEHLINGKKLISDTFNILKPGGYLLLTTPFYFNKSIDNEQEGPFSKIEDGSHVIRGYSPEMLKELCEIAGFKIGKIEYCGGFLSQKTTYLYRKIYNFNTILANFSILPLRFIIPFLDPLITKFFNWPKYSVCLYAYKPLYESN